MANSPKLFFVDMFMNLTHFSVKDVQFPKTSTKSTKYMLQKSRGVFFQKKKGPCGTHIDHGVLGGTLKSTNVDKIQKIHAPKLQGVFFLRSPKRRRQPPPIAQLGEDLKTGKNGKC